MLISKFAEDGTPIDQLTPGSERLVKLQCDTCGTMTTTTRSNHLQGQRVRKERKGRTYCRPCGKKIGGLKRIGTKSPAVAAANALRSGERHPSWRGGQYLDPSGYVMVLCNPQGANGWAKYAKQHVLVMEEHLGRQLTPEEVVHHIDNDKQNNVLANLFLTDGPGHRLAHVSLTLSFMLLRAAGLVASRKRPTIENVWQAYGEGKIYFDATQGIYVANLKLRELSGTPDR